jgi:hypothetical protein
VTAPKEQLQVLISEIDGVLQKTAPSLPWRMSGDASQQRKVLERVRNHLVALHKQMVAEARDRADVIHADLMTYDIYYQPTSGQSSLGQPSVVQPPAPAQLPPAPPAPPAPQPMVHLLRQEIVQLQATLVQPLQAELSTLRQQRETLQAEVRQLEMQLEMQRQNALLQQQTNFQYTLLQQQANLQPTLHDFLQTWLGRLQDSLSQQISQQISQSLQGLAPLARAAETSPTHLADRQPASELQLAHLDTSLRLVFESLQRDVQAYQNSLAQGLNRLYGLGQESEEMVKALLRQMSEQIGPQAPTAGQNAAIADNAATPASTIPVPAIPTPTWGSGWPTLTTPPLGQPSAEAGKAVGESPTPTDSVAPSNQANKADPRPQYAAFPYPGSELTAAVPPSPTPIITPPPNPIDAAIDDWIRDTGADQATHAVLPSEFTDLNLAELSLSQLEAQEIDSLPSPEMSLLAVPTKADAPTEATAPISAAAVSPPSIQNAELDDFYHSLFGSAGTEPPMSTGQTAEAPIAGSSWSAPDNLDQITSLADLFADGSPLSPGDRHRDRDDTALTDHPTLDLEALDLHADGPGAASHESVNGSEESFILASPEETLLPHTAGDLGSELDLELDEITFSSLSEDLFNLERQPGAGQPFPDPFLHAGDMGPLQPPNLSAADLPELEEWGNLEQDDFSAAIAADVEDRQSLLPPAPALDLPALDHPDLDDLDSLFREAMPSGFPLQSALPNPLTANEAEIQKIAETLEVAEAPEGLAGFGHDSASTENHAVAAPLLETSFTFADIEALFADVPPMASPASSPLSTSANPRSGDAKSADAKSADAKSVDPTPDLPAASFPPARFTLERLNGLFVEVPNLDPAIPPPGAIANAGESAQNIAAREPTTPQDAPRNFTLNQIGNLFLEVPTTASPKADSPDPRAIEGRDMDHPSDPVS